jgi:hypothetical protein
MIVLLPIVKSIPGGIFYQDAATGLREALTELGHTVQWFMLGEVGVLSAAESELAVQWARSGGDKLVIDLCCWGHALSAAHLEGEHGNGDVYDIAGAACVGLLYDQPYFQALSSILAKRLYAAVPDRNHAEQIALLHPGLQLAGTLFAPPAVRPQSNRSRPWNERDIDLLYIGSLAAGALQRTWRDLHNARLFDAVADAALARPDMPLHRVALTVTRALGLDCGPEELATLLREVEFFLRARLRHDMVMAVASAGQPLHLFGSGWDEVALPACVVRHPPTDYAGMLEVAGRARIALDASTYLGGANDRIFHYALNGAVSLTNAGAWLQDTFATGEGFHYYRMDALASLAADIAGLQSRPQDLRAQGERARELTLSAHTWRHRAEAILAAVRPTP